MLRSLCSEGATETGGYEIQEYDRADNENASHFRGINHDESSSHEHYTGDGNIISENVQRTGGRVVTA